VISELFRLITGRTEDGPGADFVEEVTVREKRQPSRAVERLILVVGDHRREVPRRGLGDRSLRDPRAAGLGRGADAVHGRDLHGAVLLEGLTLL